MKRDIAFTVMMVVLALVGLAALFFMLQSCALHHPVPCDPSPDCPCGPCVARDASVDR